MMSMLPITADDAGRSLGCFENGSKAESFIEALDEANRYGSLTEAVLQQYLSTLFAPSPWQRCENCGRLFKRPRGAKPNKKLRATRFCSRSCNISFNQKKRRKKLIETDNPESIESLS